MNKGYKRESSRANGFILIIVLSCSLFGGLIPSLYSAEKYDNREYKVKAAFIYNFVRFTKWPSSGKESEEGTPIVIGILGENPFGESAFAAVESRVIPSKNRKLVVKKLGSFKESMNLEECHLLFISNSEKNNFMKIISMLRGSEVMTVADTPDFVDRGGMVSLVVKGRNIRWELNDEAIKRSTLKLNAQLYRNAIKVIKKQGIE